MRNLNKPNRYNVASIQAQQTLGGDVMQADENGHYVTWRDYAWLLAENQRLQAEVEEARKGSGAGMSVMLDLNNQLVAEVERLRKAGDGMEEVIWLTGCVSGMEIKERAVKAWKQAKEGKPSV